MKIQTKAFGQIKVDPTQIIEFPQGIFAFENIKRYVLLPNSDNANFHWLQAIDEPKLAFLVIQIFDLMSDYRPNFDALPLASIGIEEDQKVDDICEFWGIVTIPPNQPEEMTINLQGPVIIHPSNKIGGQFVSNNEAYPVRAKILDLVEEQNASSGS